MKKVTVRWVPQMLCDAQKANRVDASTSLLRLFNENPDKFISRFLTVDETWLHHFIPESKVQSMAWKYGSSPVNTSQKFSRCCVGWQSYSNYSGLLRELC